MVRHGFDKIECSRKLSYLLYLLTYLRSGLGLEDRLPGLGVGLVNAD